MRLWKQSLTPAVLCLLLAGQAHGRAQPKPTVTTKPGDWAFVGEGVLDLNLVDCSKPVAVKLTQSPGHFVRVLFPKLLVSDRYTLTSSSGVDVFMKTRGQRTAIDISGSIFVQGHKELVSIQDGQGSAIILVVQLVGRIPPQAEAYSFLQFQSEFQAQNRMAFPEDAGPNLLPAKPVIRLRNPLLSRCLVIEKLENRRGGEAVFILKNDLECQDDDGVAVVPTGTKLIGRALFDPKDYEGKNTLELTLAVYPDGQPREVEGTLGLEGSSLRQDWP